MNKKLQAIYDAIEWVEWDEVKLDCKLISQVEQRAKKYGCLPGELASLYVMQGVQERKLALFLEEQSKAMLEIEAMKAHILGL